MYLQSLIWIEMYRFVVHSQNISLKQQFLMQFYECNIKCFSQFV